jgi:hypothetical protein
MNIDVFANTTKVFVEKRGKGMSGDQRSGSVTSAPKSAPAKPKTRSFEATFRGGKFDLSRQPAPKR